MGWDIVDTYSPRRLKMWLRMGYHKQHTWSAGHFHVMYEPTDIHKQQDEGISSQLQNMCCIVSTNDPAEDGELDTINGRTYATLQCWSLLRDVEGCWGLYLKEKKRGQVKFCWLQNPQTSLTCSWFNSMAKVIGDHYLVCWEGKQKDLWNQQPKELAPVLGSNIYAAYPRTYEWDGQHHSGHEMMI